MIEVSELLRRYRASFLKFDLKSRLDKKFLKHRRISKYGIKVLLNLHTGVEDAKVQLLVARIEAKLNQIS